MSAKHVSATRYLLAYVALVILASLSVTIAKSTHVPFWDVAISLGIAVIKAGVVLWVFMHLSETTNQIRFGLALSVSLLLTLLLLTTADVATRHDLPPAPRPEASEAFYQR